MVRQGVLAWGLCGAACQGSGGVTVDCDPAPQSRVEALATVDRDGDGQLTAADLASGEAAAVVHWTGREGPGGRAVAVARDGRVGPGRRTDWDPVWWVPVPAACDPEVYVGVAFFAPDRSTDALSVGTADVVSTEFGTLLYEMRENEASVVVEATMALTSVSADRISGHLDGTVSAGLLFLVGEAPWDQTYTVEALAFRDIEATVDAR
ncbi:MAG: hypothetical protein AAF211_19005 [Myxococcota bacterium]